MHLWIFATFAIMETAMHSTTHTDVAINLISDHNWNIENILSSACVFMHLLVSAFMKLNNDLNYFAF